MLLRLPTVSLLFYFPPFPHFSVSTTKSLVTKGYSCSMWIVWLKKPDESVQKYAGGGIVTPRRRYGRSQSLGFFPWNQCSTMYIGVCRCIHRTPEYLCSTENILGLAAIMFTDRYHFGFPRRRVRINRLKKINHPSHPHVALEVASQNKLCYWIMRSPSYPTEPLPYCCKRGGMIMESVDNWFR